MRRKKLIQALLIYGALSLLALLLLLLHIGGILPGLLLMGLVMGAVNLATLLGEEEEEPPCDPRL